MSELSEAHAAIQHAIIDSKQLAPLLISLALGVTGSTVRCWLFRGRLYRLSNCSHNQPNDKPAYDPWSFQSFTSIMRLKNSTVKRLESEMGFLAFVWGQVERPYAGSWEPGGHHFRQDLESKYVGSFSDVFGPEPFR